MRAKTVYEAIGFERGKDPKEAMGIGTRYKLIISPYASKSAYYEDYTRWTEFILYKITGGKEEKIAEGQTGPGYMDSQKGENYYRNFIEFLKAHGLKKTDAEIIRWSTSYDSGNYH
jgi:hypothetical protein